MLTFHDPRRFGRRDFLRIGTMSLGGLTFGGAGSALASESRSTTDRSVVFLFLHGGPSQIETFDPHMDSPIETRCATGEIRTTLPGVTFGSSFPETCETRQPLGNCSIVRARQCQSRHQAGRRQG